MGSTAGLEDSPARLATNRTEDTNVRRVLWLVISFLLFVAPARGQDVPVFSGPPRLATSVEGLKRIKASVGFAKVRKEAVDAAEALLKNSVVVPEGWGNWVFYYACPDDGSTLVALSPT